MFKMLPQGKWGAGEAQPPCSPRVPSELPLFLGLWSSLPAHLRNPPPPLPVTGDPVIQHPPLVILLVFKSILAASSALLCQENTVSES